MLPSCLSVKCLPCVSIQQHALLYIFRIMSEYLQRNNYQIYLYFTWEVRTLRIRKYFRAISLLIMKQIFKHFGITYARK
jgi:hypothetical protein